MLTDAESSSLLASQPSPERKNIVFFDHTSKISGGEIALFNLVTTLNTDKYRVVVVVCSDGPLVEKLQAAKIETHIFPLADSVLETRKESLGVSSLLQLKKALMTFNYSIKLAGFFRNLKADLIHANSLKSDLIGGLAARVAAVPIIWHVRDRIADDYLPGKVVKVFKTLCDLLPNHVITISQATRATLPGADNPEASFNKKLTIVHDGVAPDAIRTSDRRWKSNDQVVIGIIGRLSPWKGQHIFLKAAAQVHKEFPNAIFQIIGSALFGEREYEASLHQLTETLKLEQCVQFLGFRENILDVIESVDIIVHASTTAEPFGQVVVEGMASQKPVIATKGGGVLEIIEDGVSGLLVPMNDENAMAEAIKELLRNPERSIALGLNGQKRVQDKFLIEHTARNVERVYETILGPRFK
ncbi:MAG: glycosyltransferase family 4 protein [Cyanobacteria bacterium SZAS-4]|nr:glycosyltransferase family 4 protein [Cyanobacteria bacterium SZAS-4]